MVHPSVGVLPGREKQHALTSAPTQKTTRPTTPSPRGCRTGAWRDGKQTAATGGCTGRGQGDGMWTAGFHMGGECSGTTQKCRPHDSANTLRPTEAYTSNGGTGRSGNHASMAPFKMGSKGKKGRSWLCHPPRILFPMSPPGVHVRSEAPLGTPYAPKHTEADRDQQSPPACTAWVPCTHCHVSPRSSRAASLPHPRLAGDRVARGFGLIFHPPLAPGPS